MIRVYVAASSSLFESVRVLSAIDALYALHVRVTCTWPDVVASAPGGGNPRDATWAVRARWSRQCLREIEDSDILWMLVPDIATPTRGAWIESGYALTKGKIVLFSGDTKQSVFCALGEEYGTDAEAMARIAWLTSQIDDVTKPRTRVAAPGAAQDYAMPSGDSE